MVPKIVRWISKWRTTSRFFRSVPLVVSRSQAIFLFAGFQCSVLMQIYPTCFESSAHNTKRLRPRSHYSAFVSIRFCCIEATCSHCSVFVQKRREKPPFSCVHTDLPDNKNAAKNIRFCAFTLLRFCEAHCWILERFQKPPFLCVHIDQMRFQKPPFFWISTFDSVFENLRFCGVFCGSVWTLSQKRRFFSPFMYKNGVGWTGPKKTDINLVVCLKMKLVDSSLRSTGLKSFKSLKRWV